VICRGVRASEVCSNGTGIARTETTVNGIKMRIEETCILSSSGIGDQLNDRGADTRIFMFMASLIGDLPPIRHAGDVHNWNVSYRSQSLITLGYSRYHAGIQPPHVFQSMSTNRTSAIMTCTPVLGSAVFQAACFIFHDTNGGPKSRSIVCTGRCLHNFPSLTWSICYFVVFFGQNISTIVKGYQCVVWRRRKCGKRSGVVGGM